MKMQILIKTIYVLLSLIGIRLTTQSKISFLYSATMCAILAVIVNHL
jgi:hypothetical protein